MRSFGVYAKKIGMMSIFNEDNDIVPVTVLKMLNHSILKKAEGRMKVLVNSSKKLKSPQMKELNKFGCEETSGFIREMESSEISDFEEYFKGIKYVDIKGKNKGKGFAGVMKRHHFKCGRATHGASLSHRQVGSTGMRTEMGKTYKGRKMPGRLGGKNMTQQNLKVIRAEKDILMVKGSVPGPKKAILFVCKAIKRPS